MKTVYIPAVVNKWENGLKRDDGTHVVKMRGPSIGFMAVYATREDCMAEFPDRDVIEMETAE